MKYVFEVIAIVIGITLSFMVDERRDEIRDRETEEIILSHMLQNLEQDIDDLGQNIRADSTTISSLRLVLNHLESDLPYDSSLDNHFRRLTYITNFFNDQSAYENLKSSGVKLVKNDSLRNQISNYYENAAHYVLDVENKMINPHVVNIQTPIMMKRFNYASMFNPATPNNYEALKTDIEFKSSCRTFIALSEWKSRISSNCIVKAKSLMDNIQKQIK